MWQQQIINVSHSFQNYLLTEFLLCARHHGRCWRKQGIKKQSDCFYAKDLLEVSHMRMGSES